PLMSRGGTIAIHTYSADLKAGGVIDVSGGVIVSGDGTRSYGAGGSLTINAGQDLTVKSVLGGSLAMESTLKGYSGGRGGSLSILAPLIRIGGASTQPGTLTLSPEFFRQGGFASYNLSALGAASERAGEFVPAIVIAANTRIEPVAESWVAMTDAAGTTLRPVLAPEGIRSPVSLGFNAVGVVDTYIPTTLLARGDFVMNEGASIRTDARGSVAIEGNTVALLGSIEAPAGAISVAGKNNSAILLLNSAESAVTNVELGARSLLSTAGTTLLIPDPRGYRTGSVLDGGMISVSGNIVAQAGSVLDVSGTNDVLDFRPSFSTVDVPVHGPLNGSFMGYELTPTKVESNAGMITLKGDQMLFTDATLRGFAGGTTALGGQLVVSSGRFSAPSAPAQTPLEPTLAVTQGGVAIPGGFGSGGAIGQIVSGTAGSPLASMGHFAVNHFLGGGFDALTLGGTVQFDGPVSIHARRSLNIADAGVLYANSTVHLEAPYVALGSVFRAPIGLKDPDNPFTIGSLPFNFSPTYGRGDLTVVASLIDIGNLSLQNVGRASLIARNGDIRGDGTLNISGALNM
ncbi:MAG: hypothetical protein V4710_07835, partial [Verrucomicrobiota bacterium]